jgi:predicted Kef-type K+ transport protein
LFLEKITDPLWLLLALLLGFAARQIRLPPLVGFLCAGFSLHALGVDGGPVLQKFADLGVTLLLFTIGLKLRLRNLLAPEVWGTAGIHMSLSVFVFSGFLLLPGLAGFAWLGSMDWQEAAVLAFALSFSSTVFAVKILEDRGEMKTRHGQVAIGILIVQDIIAVAFLTLATDKSITLWALALIALPLLRPLLNNFMERSGHGEVLVLFGIFMALGGGELFELVGLKADLGALVLGVLLSEQRKSAELTRALLSFKDLFLVGFFLSIGIDALPSMADISIAVVLVLLLLPLKTLLFFGLLSSLRLRVRTAYLSAASLANFSEFGLIVAAVGAGAGWLDRRWLVTIAIALAISFVIGSIINARAHSLYPLIEKYLRIFEAKRRLPVDIAPDLGEAEILIVGMGRVGRGAYLKMRETYADKVCGIDADAEQVARNRLAGHNVMLADAEDADFWHDVDHTKLRLVMLALPTLKDMQQSAKLLNNSGFEGTISAVAKFDDDCAALEAAGVHATFNFYAEAGAGFAEHVRKRIRRKGMQLDE